MLAKTCNGKNKIDLHFLKIDIYNERKKSGTKIVARSAGKIPRKKQFETLWTLG